MKKSLMVGGTGVVLVSVFVIGAYVFKNQQTKAVIEQTTSATSPLIRENAVTLGDKDAKVHIVEFMDPGCETCRVFHPFVKSLLAQHAGQVKLTIRYLPLHQGADTMVKILEASRKQDRYWQTLHVLFETQPQWASHHHPRPERAWEFLPEAGLDLEVLRRDIEDPAITALLQQDMADAQALNIRKTPAFFVNGQPLQQFGKAQLAALVQATVAKHY